MAHGENINLFLIDGSISGLIQCKIANWKGVAYKIPRTELEECKKREHLKQSGVYFLLGKPDDEGKPIAYIGQAGVRKNGEGILYRLQEHVRNPGKDYWTETIAFTTVDNSLGPTEICYLEHKFYDIAKKVNRYTVKNGNDPSPGNISEEKESELERFIEYAKLVMGVLGHKIFEKLTDNKNIQPASNSQKIFGSSEVIFYLGRKQNKDEKATGKRTSEGFIVFAGSPIHECISESLSSGYKNLRTKHAPSINSEDKLKEDILFTSPSAAASFVLGGMANGNTKWKTDNGKSLADVESEEAN